MRTRDDFNRYKWCMAVGLTDSNGLASGTMLCVQNLSSCLTPGMDLRTFSVHDHLHSGASRRKIVNAIMNVHPYDPKPAGPESPEAAPNMNRALNLTGTYHV